jgi:anti-sigma regulatory factor (Ser/Thr protein kinase)
MATEPELPGMVAAAAGSQVVTHRAAPNIWWLSLADAPALATEVLNRLQPTSMPSEALMALQRVLDPGQRSSALAAKLELDVCGAWLTVANGCVERPVVVRRAGWVDLRGHPSAALGGTPSYEPTDDRVGLGPGDVLVLRLGPAAPDDPVDDAVDDDLLDSCLQAAGESADAMADAVHDRVGGRVVALGVPADLGEDPLLRVAAATGVPAHEVQTPGYPLGDLQPDLWKRPPRPPRLARLRLSVDRSSVASARSLLDRLLASWRLDRRVDPDAVKLVASELAANAVVHSGDPETVTVRYLGDVVRIEVVDRSSRQPVARNDAADALGGRGLHLVEALGSAWGSEPISGGKRVWCDLAVANGG